MKSSTFTSRKAGLVTMVFVFALAALSIQIVGVFANNNKSVTGSGETTSGIVLTVSAVEHENGNVTGHAMFHNRETNSKISIDVTEIEVVGNKAIVDGEVVKRTGSYADECTGTHAVFAVQDNGEGGDTPVDWFTLVSCYTPERGEYKNVRYFGDERGNLQVRGW